ncbi:hypothetical protein WA158_001488 [Blastocystis sp. Blastoise]
MSDDNPFADDGPVIAGPPAQTLASSSAAPQAAPAKNAITSKISNISTMPIQHALRLLRIINALTGLVICIIGVFLFVSFVIAFQIPQAILCAYAVIFGFFLFLFELQFKKLNLKLRNSYGFLFTYLGRSIFIFFTSTIILSLQSLFGYIIGGCVFLVALYNILILFIHPAFKGGNMKIFDDPTVGYTSGENEMAELLKKNPQLAQKALSATMKVASQTTA